MVDLDAGFIEKWHPLYERTESDEPEYQHLISAFSRHRPAFVGVPESRLQRLVHWKSARIYTRVDYSALARAIGAAAMAPEAERLAILDVVGYVGPPVASTILHFMYPDTFPIYDVRTAEVLYAAGLIASDKTDADNYPDFVNAIFLIKGRAPDYSLRQIDRALFSFHKQAFRPSAPKSTPQPRAFTRPAASGGTRTMTNHDMIAAAVRGARGQELSRGEIWHLVRRKFPHFNEGSLLPNDHAAGNKGACRCAGSPNRIFDRLDSGRYRVR